MSPPLRRALASAAVPVLPFVFLVLALLPASVATQTGAPDARGVRVGVESQPPRPREEERGISGYVLAPDGLPVTGGTVSGAGSTASIGSTGRFRLLPRGPGLFDIVVIVPGLAPHRVKVQVPSSTTLQLPVIRLSPATYFRVRLASAAGDPLSPRFIRRSLDGRGQAIPEALESQVAEQSSPDGTTTIGPLPRGVTVLAIDPPLLARTRLPDVWVTGETPLIDGGTVIVEPGAVLNVDIVDAAGAPVPEHEVSLEDAAPLSPLTFPPIRTNRQGRATFTRLSAGRYRVHTGTEGRCGAWPLMIERAVVVPSRGAANTRIVIGGRAAFRLSSPLGPLRAVRISALPESTPQSSQLPLPVPGRGVTLPPIGRSFRPLQFPTPCNGATDADGRVTLATFPPGPARLTVHMLNSTWVRTVTVPIEEREIAIEIPTGYLPVRVLDGRNRGRVAEASIAWTAGRARVEAAASASGEALLEGVAIAPGTLVISSPRHEPFEIKLPEPPDVLYEVTLVPLRDRNLRVRVATPAGAPVPNAVVELIPDDTIEVGQIVVTDAKGLVSLSDPPSGALRVTAAADGLVAAATRIAEDVSREVVLTLSRGYRVIGDVESSIGVGRHPIRIVGSGGASMDHLLDAASDRSLTPPGRLSLGPLAPGSYVVELHGPQGQWQAKVQIVDRDVPVTFQ